jgi:hypothetical protein
LIKSDGKRKLQLAQWMRGENRPEYPSPTTRRAITKEGITKLLAWRKKLQKNQQQSATGDLKDCANNSAKNILTTRQAVRTTRRKIF